MILQLPDFNKPFRLDTDACNYGVGASLEQPHENTINWKPVAFFSKHLSTTQQKYSTSERELLKSILTANELSPRLARWSARLQMFDIEIVYREGKKHGNADGLSRLAYEEADEEDECQVPLTPIYNINFSGFDLKCESELEFEDDEEVEDEYSEFIDYDQDTKSDEEVEINVRTIKVDIDFDSINVIHLKANQIDQQQQNDPNLAWIYNLIMKEKYYDTKVDVLSFENKEQESLYKQKSRLRIQNKTLYREYVDETENVLLQYVVPSHLKEYFIEKAHQCAFSGHQGRQKTLDRLTSRCYWPNQSKDVENYVRQCEICQLIKGPQQYNVGELIPLRPSKPLEIVNTDIMGKLKETKNANCYILAIIDHFTKWLELFPLKTMEASEVADKITAFVCRHGVPVKLLSDQGTNYQSELISELYDALDIERARTTPYHPEGDGLTERVNRTIIPMIAAYVNVNHDNWDELLPQVQFAYNTAVHSTTNCSPFELMYGRQPRIPLDLFIPNAEIDLQLKPDDYAENLVSSFQSAYEIVKTNRDIRMDKNKIYYDRRVRAPDYAVGDTVSLLDQAKKPAGMNKFKKKWIGPYTVVDKRNKVNFLIKPCKKNGKRKWVHINKLRSYFAKTDSQPEIKKEPIVIGDTIDDQNDDSCSELLRKPKPKKRNNKPRTEGSRRSARLQARETATLK